MDIQGLNPGFTDFHIALTPITALTQTPLAYEK